MSEALIGEIRMFAGACAPRGWAPCDGRQLSIERYSDLFSVLGTTYGGDGMTTFALPDMRGRVPLHPGLGPGLMLRGSPHTPTDVQRLGPELPRDELQPFTPVNFIIALEGKFPAWGGQH